MSAPRPISEDDLHAYVDEALSSTRRQEVEAYLAAHPDEAKRIGSYVADRAVLRDALAGIAEEPIPPELGLRALIEARRIRQAHWRPAIAAAAVLVVGGLAGWTARGVFAPPPNGVGALSREAADNYRVYASDVHRPVEMDSAQKADLVRWVSNRLRSPVAVPDLSGAGYHFIGGRLVTTPHGPAAMFIYDDANGLRLAVMVRPMEREKNAAMVEREDEDLNGVSWATDGLGYSLVAPRSPNALYPLADEVRRQVKGGF
ncbi:anti-sigma factor [uncultured Caulobacter sp.]|uniref:anti-sigma factor family protein n=1 Tax=uncultured Caulobacter sp. TaxID=158749 RepID=UPI0026357AEE|nr:anti-sigma factor [uncultured Caulobacter sp.]